MSHLRITRRELIKTAGAALPINGVSLASGSQGSNPGTGVTVGISTLGFPKHTNAQLAEELAGRGIRTVQLFLNQSDSRYWKYNGRSDLSDLTASRCAAIARAYRSAGLAIHSMGVYTNLIHGDAAERQANLVYFESMMKAGEEMFGQLTPWIDCLHAKDRKLHVDQGVAAGQGDLEYRKFVSLAIRRTPKASFILEYVGPDNYQQAPQHLQKAMREVGTL